MTFKKCNVAGLVTLYNSEIQVIENINSYLNQIAHLFVIDNSEIVNYKLIKHFKAYPNVTYIANGANMGIAYALNQAANKAIMAGYQFLLTMDDDTYFPAGGVQKMLAFVDQYGSKKLGIIAAQADPRLFDNTIKTVPYTITSGSMLNLSAYRECGHFMDELFIDFVDQEYCFRLRKYGYDIIEINSIHLKHSLGEKKQLNFLHHRFPIYWTSHNPLRIYYKTRNCIFSLNKYNLLEMRIKLIFYKVVFKDLLKIIFLENKKRIRMILFIKGFYDGLIGNLGKRTFEI